VGLKVLNGEISLNPSKNRWDWLGSGIYFWEQNPVRALEYAEECAEGKQRNSGRIEIPFVVGAIIELGNCLNLVEPKSIVALKHAHDRLEVTVKESGDKMPINKGANRMLDCAVVQFVHESQKRESEETFDIFAGLPPIRYSDFLNTLGQTKNSGLDFRMISILKKRSFPRLRKLRISSIILQTPHDLPACAKLMPGTALWYRYERRRFVYSRDQYLQSQIKR
jgi:hypothetical protein